jgi:hypothetical protein
VLFADEDVGYAGRRFECGWPGRPQSAADIAGQVMQLAQRLGTIDPAYLLRPDPGMRKFRPDDPGPIVDMKPAELADLIDRHGRFDPPQPPAPVGETGYTLLYRNDLKGTDPASLWVSIRAGVFGASSMENRVGIRPSNQHPLWRDPERGIDVLEAMVEAWNPLWICAYALVDLPSEDDEIKDRARPWLAWTAKPLKPRPNPPYARPYPAPFPLDDAGPPAEVRAWQGGELHIWP